MILQLHIGQAQAHVGSGGHRHDVDSRAEGNQEGSAHSGGGDAIAGDNLIDNGQDAIGQRITVDEHAQGAVYGGENHVQVGSHACGHGRQDYVGHGIQHGALAHNANEHAGGQGGKGHGKGIEKSYGWAGVFRETRRYFYFSVRTSILSPSHWDDFSGS